MNKKLRIWLRLSIYSMGFVTFLGVFAGCYIYFYLIPKLPTVDTLKDVRFQVPLTVFTADGKLMAVFGEKRRSPIAIDRIPENLKNAFLAGEDSRFYQHPGVDYQGIMRAAIYLIKEGKMGPGGSTITMQLARNFFLTFERTFERKLNEMLLALIIERELSKEEILALYLNKIYLGYRAYGVVAAARQYYGKDLQELTLAEYATIASLPKAPSRINPVNNPKRTLRRRNHILGRMLKLGFIDKAAHQQALDELDRAYLHGPAVEVEADYIAEMVRAEMTKRLGQKAYTGGYRVTTSIDSRLQLAANNSIRNALNSYDVRHGYRGAEATIKLADDTTIDQWQQNLKSMRTVSGLIPGLVTEVSPDLAMVHLADGQTLALTTDAITWARPYISVDRVGARPTTLDQVVAKGDIIRLSRNNEGEWRLSQLPKVQGAIISMDPKNGRITALSGGYNYRESKFNRAIQGKRQPGSSFKPFIYSAALERGFTTASLVNDAPVVFDDPSLERSWRPENYSGRVFGPTRLREGMVNSRNLVSIRVLKAIGIQFAREYASNFGFDIKDLPSNLSMALGSASLSPLSMARAYSVFANGGFLVEPWFIDSVQDADGTLIFFTQKSIACDNDCTIADLKPRKSDTFTENGMAPLINENLAIINKARVPQSVTAPRIISEQNNYIINSILRDVVKRGTGKKAMQLGRNDLAGKTGTTNEQRDAWFSGFNHALVTTSWVGFDRLAPLGKGEVGGKAALPMWISFMRQALEGIAEIPLKQPSGINMVRIDPDSGLLATPETKNSILEVFRNDKIPTTSDSQAHKSDDNPYDIF